MQDSKLYIFKKIWEQNIEPSRFGAFESRQQLLAIMRSEPKTTFLSTPELVYSTPGNLQGIVSLEKYFPVQITITPRMEWEYFEIFDF